MITTLYELLNVCEKAIDIYNVKGEELGQDGDIEMAEDFFESALRLEKIISNIKEEYPVNNTIPFHTILDWLKKEENKMWYTEIKNALFMVTETDTYEIEKRKKRIEYINEFLK